MSVRSECAAAAAATEVPDLTKNIIVDADHDECTDDDVSSDSCHTELRFDLFCRFSVFILLCFALELMS